MKRTPSAPNATLTMRSATVSRVLVGHVNADVNVPTTQVRVVSRPITPRHVVRCRVFDATSFTSRQHRSRWFEPTAALRDGVETGQSGGLGVSLRAPGGHSRVTHSRNPADTGGHERTWRGRRLSTGGHWRSRWDTGGHDVRPVRDREAPGSNPGPPTKNRIQIEVFACSAYPPCHQGGHRWIGGAGHPRPLRI